MEFGSFVRSVGRICRNGASNCTGNGRQGLVAASGGAKSGWLTTLCLGGGQAPTAWRGFVS